MKKTKNIVIVSLFLLLLSCSEKKPVTLPPTPVTVSTVIEEDVPIFIETIGYFTAYNSVKIQAQVEGPLLDYFFVEGTEVQAGSLLFQIDPRPYQAILDETIATLKQNEANLKFAQDKVIRYSSLVEDDFVSKLDYEQYLTDEALYEATIEENIAQITKAEIDLGYCTIFSPITGISGKRLIDPGNLITNAGADLLVINQITPIYVDFSVPERYFDKVLQKQKISPLIIDIKVPNTEIKTEAKLQMINNKVNQETGMIALRGIYENEEKGFWPGQFIRIRLVLDIQKNAEIVPTSSLNVGQKGQYVWLVQNEKVVNQYVKVGERFDGKAVILEGVKKGDLVVTKGQLNLRPGLSVTVKSVDGKPIANSK